MPPPSAKPTLKTSSSSPPPPPSSSSPSSSPSPPPRSITPKMAKNAIVSNSIKSTNSQTESGADQQIKHMFTIHNNNSTLHNPQNNTSILFYTKNTKLATDSSAAPGSNRTPKTTVPTTVVTSTPLTFGRTRTTRTRQPSIKIKKVSGGDKKTTTTRKTTLTTTELPLNVTTDETMTSRNISAPFPTKSFNGIDHKGTAGHSQADGLIGGIDQNYVIVGSILGGLFLIVIIAALILWTRKHRNKLFKRRHSGSMDITAPCGLPDSPSSPTVNVSERMELIRPNSAGGVVCFNNNGAVSYHKDEVYLTIWDVNKNEEQPQQRQQQNEADDHVDSNVKTDISQSVSPPTSRPQSSQQNVYSNHSSGPDESPIKGEASSIDSQRENHSRPSSEQNVYANYTLDRTSPGNDNRSSDNPLLERKASDGDPECNVYVNYSASQKELREHFGQDNDGFEGEKEGSIKLSTDKDQDVTKGNVIDETGIKSEDADVSTHSNKHLGHTPTASEHFYECEDSEPDTDHRPSQLSRDSGIDADQDIDNYYDVPTAALDRLRRGQIKKSDNKSDGSSPNAKCQNPELKVPVSDYYMSPSSDNECEISNESDYENTKKNRPETYLCPDNLDLTSPTDEDELLKIYDNFELQARKLSTPNSCLYETPSELDQIYDMPASVKASDQCPQSQPASFEKFLSSSMPASIDIRKNKGDTLKKSISCESTNPEVGHHPELETPKITNSSIEPPQANYVNTPETNNIYSVASDAQDSETEEAEYDTPKEISQSPFFHNIDQNKIKLGTRSLPPASKPPPPRLNRPKPLKIQNQREQSNTLSPKSSEAHSYSQTLPRADVENKPRTTPKNFKSLTLDNLSRKDNPQRIGSGRKRAVLPIDKSSPLIGISQKIPEDDEFSGVYSTPRSPVKEAKALPGNQGGKSLETTRNPKDITGRSQAGYRNENGQKLGTHEILSKTPKKSFTGSSNSLDNAGKLDMGELQNAMKKKGLNN